MNKSDKFSRRIFGFDGRNLKYEEKILPLVYNLRFEYLLVNPDMYERLKAPQRMKVIVNIDGSNVELEAIPKEAIIMSVSDIFLQNAHEKGYSTAFYRKIDNREDMEAAWKAGSRFDFVVVEFADETNIPLELIIARLQDRKTVLLKLVNSPTDAEISLGVMEVGSDGVVLKSENIQDILEVNNLIAKEELGSLELVKAKVINVEHIGMGFRACIDTTNLLGKNEGMIIGSTSRGGLLVSSETHYLPYMELRPFRVNAGAVHSYVWTPNGMTAYLTELKAGSKILCVDSNGDTREVSVGRVKIEMRPLLKIEAEADGVTVNTIVQDDWHIRIFGGDGQVCNASAIKKGDELLAYICKGGRHVGIEIKESLEER